MITGGIIQFVGLFAMGGLGLSTGSKQQKIAIVAMLSLFGAGFGFGWGPLPYVITTEVPSVRLKKHTQRLGFLVNVLTL